MLSWQNHQFWGSGEFALPFGDYEVNITVPADHVLDGTGVLQNRKEVFSKTMLKRYEQAKKSYDKPVLIVTQEEAEEAEKGFSEKTKTWKLKAENVRDFGFATSRKFIWDMQAVKIGGKDIMAVSMYPKEGNPLWKSTPRRRWPIPYGRIQTIPLIILILRQSRYMPRTKVWNIP